MRLGSRVWVTRDGRMATRTLRGFGMAIVMCGDDCTTEQKNSGHRCGDPQLSYVGAVLAKYEENHYDDSDFCALVWDAESESVTSITYASTRGWTYHNGATVDASPGVLAAAQVWAEDRWTAELTRRAEIEATIPAKGKTVRSMTKRGKNVGITGRVMWYGVDKYKSDRFVTYYRVGIKVEGEDTLRYLSADSVQVIDAEPIDYAAITEQAHHAARSNGVRSAYMSGWGSVMGPLPGEYPAIFRATADSNATN